LDPSASRNLALETQHITSLEGLIMQTGYNLWLGQAVVLQVVLGDVQVPLRGKLLKEGGDTVRMRIGEGWDIDIYKNMILGVEEDCMALMPA
jgi:hypothetical protein